MSAKAHNQFGLSGQDSYDYNYFVGRGKKGEKRKGRIRGAVKAVINRKLNRGTTRPSLPSQPVRQEVKRSAMPMATNDNPAVIRKQVVKPEIPTNIPAVANTPIPGNTDQISSEEMLNDEVSEMENIDSEFEEEEYSNFLGFGKKAKAKRKLKNEEKKASIERTRAETQLMVSGMTPTATSSGVMGPAPGTQSAQPLETGSTQDGEKKEEEKTGSDMTTILIIAAGVVVVLGVGIVVMTSKKPPAQKIAAQAL